MSGPLACEWEQSTCGRCGCPCAQPGKLLSPKPELWVRWLAGVGSEHAKWSPVATAWYRLHPELVILEVLLLNLHIRSRSWL